MAQAMILLTDLPDGKVDLQVELSPQADNDSEAQQTAIKIIEIIEKQLGSVNVPALQKV